MPIIKSFIMTVPNLEKKATPISHDTPNIVEVAKTRSGKDVVLWLIAVLAMIGATLSPQYLGGYWAAANNEFVRIAVVVGLVISALACIAFTHQGGAFKVLLKDAGVELKRITWPSKDETVTYTWQVVVVTIVVGILVWILDNIFTKLVGLVLGG